MFTATPCAVMRQGSLFMSISYSVVNECASQTINHRWIKRREKNSMRYLDSIYNMMLYVKFYAISFSDFINMLCLQ